MKIKVIIIVILISLISISSFGLYSLKKVNDELDKALKQADEKENLLNELIEYNKAHPFKDADIDLYEENLKKIAEDNNVVGMSIVVFHNEDILETYNYGYSDKADNILANDDTKYRIASISKVITTIGLMRLYDKGYFKLNEKIDDVINTNCYGDVTFKDLLTHTSGIYDSYAFNRAASGERYTLEYVIANSFYNDKPGSNYEYTNLGLASVGGIIEHLTGEYFEDYMRDLFLELGIDASYVADTISDKNNIAKLYDVADGSINDPKTWWKTSEFYKSYGLGNSYLTGCGDLMISAKDLAKFAMALCNEGSYDGIQILSAKATELMLTDNFDYYVGDTYKYSEGLSCHNFKTLVDNREIHGHTGAAYGVYTAMYFDPSDNTGVIILDNGASRIQNEKGYVSLLYDIANLTYKEFFIC